MSIKQPSFVAAVPLADGSGNTLDLFTTGSPTTSACTVDHGDCAGSWPSVISSDSSTDPRMDFWRSAVGSLGADPDQLERIDLGLDPLLIIGLVLPATSAEERSELLWALGEFERRQPCRASGISSAVNVA